MSVQLKFYYDLMSQPARALYMFLKLNQIPHEPCYVNIGKGECLIKKLQEGVLYGQSQSQSSRVKLYQTIRKCFVPGDVTGFTNQNFFGFLNCLHI